VNNVKQKLMMQPWPVLACNTLAMLIGTKIALTNFVRNASSGTAVSASVKTSALGVMLLIAANVVNLTLAITVTNMDALTAWRYNHAPFVTFGCVPTAMILKDLELASFVVTPFVIIMVYTVTNAT